MARFISVCMALQPKDVTVIPCDQFDVNEDGSISAYYNGELWGHFVDPVYAHIIDDDVLAALGVEEVDEDDDEEVDIASLNGYHSLAVVEDESPEAVDEVVIPDDVSELATDDER